MRQYDLVNYAALRLTPHHFDCMKHKRAEASYVTVSVLSSIKR